jgi:DNA-binding response OmpR family regulator
MEHPKVLFALSDNVERSKLETVLRPLDIEPIVVKDGAGLIERAVKEHPAVIVTDIGLKVIGAEKVLSILRHNAQSSSIPFFFISDRAIDIADFKPGTDTFLLRPLNAEEVLARFTRTLESGAGRRTGSREIIGKLNQMGLPDILQFLNINKRDGELRVARGALRGTIYLKKGEVLNAVLEGVDKEKALYRMLGWPDGEFEFIPCTVAMTRKILASSSNLLMEGMRQISIRWSPSS